MTPFDLNNGQAYFLERAVKLAEAALLQQRHGFAFDRNMFVAGYKTPHTESCNLKYDQLTQAIELLGSLVAPVKPGQLDRDTK